MWGFKLASDWPPEFKSWTNLCFKSASYYFEHVDYMPLNFPFYELFSLTFSLSRRGEVLLPRAFDLISYPSIVFRGGIIFLLIIILLL